MNDHHDKDHDDKDGGYQLCPLEGVGGRVEDEHGEDEPPPGVHHVAPISTQLLEHNSSINKVRNA